MRAEFINRALFTLMAICLSAVAIFFSSQAEAIDPLSDCMTLLNSKVAHSFLDIEKPTVIIVDGYSSGRFLAPEFKNHGYQVVHVHSAGKPLKRNYEQSFNKFDYDLDIRDVRSVGDALDQLDSFENIVGVVTGADSGVLFSDELAAGLKLQFPDLPTNGVDLARKDKYLQNERLKRLDIASAVQLATGDTNEAVRWVKKNNFLERDGRVVIKPLRSASTDGVFFCKSEDEIREAMAKLVGSKDEFGQLNNRVLIQEFLNGPEYVVNTTSLNGHHVVTDIWLYNKDLSADGLRDIYGYDVLLPFEGEPQKTLVAYALQVLDALGVKNGNGHTEIKMVSDRGPVLVEMNNRMMGSGMPRVAQNALGHSQLDRTVLSFTDPAAFLKLPVGYAMTKSAAFVSIANSEEGRKLNPEVTALIKNIPGYFSHSFNYTFDDLIPLTIDLNTVIGDVVLISDDQAELMKSVEAVKRLQSTGEFTLP